jgi:hypothetical protein
MNNRRAAHMDTMRNQARQLFPDLSDDEIELKVREMEREKLRLAGAKGSETYRRRAEQQRIFDAQRPEIVAQAELVIQQAELLAAMVRGAAVVQVAA